MLLLFGLIQKVTKKIKANPIAPRVLPPTRCIAAYTVLNCRIERTFAEPNGAHSSPGGELKRQVGKDYARSKSISLTELVEKYLRSLAEKPENETEVTPLVKRLTGVIPDEPSDQLKSDYYEHLTRKHA